MQNHYLWRDDCKDSRHEPVAEASFKKNVTTERLTLTMKSVQSGIGDLWQRWEIIITNSHFEKLLLCVITIVRTVLLDIIKAHFLLPSLGQLWSVRKHVNKGHPLKRSG